MQGKPCWGKDRSKLGMLVQLLNPLVKKTSPLRHSHRFGPSESPKNLVLVPKHPTSDIGRGGQKAGAIPATPANAHPDR